MKALFQNAMAKARLFIALAKNKVTTYVGIAVAAIAQLAGHAQEIVDSWPSLAGYLPKVPVLQSLSTHALSALGVLVVYTRVRRMLNLHKEVN